MKKTFIKTVKDAKVKRIATSPRLQKALIDLGYEEVEEKPKKETKAEKEAREAAEKEAAEKEAEGKEGAK